MSMLAMLGMLGAGAITSAGSIYANQKNIQQQQKANSEQINLSNTAHQREVLDLYAAGLNPVLSAGGSGASTPSLGAANMVNPAEGIADGLTNASKLASAEYKANVDNLKANTAYHNELSSASSVARTGTELANELARQELEAQRPRLEAEAEENSAYQEAVNKSLGITHYTKNGVVHTNFDKRKYDDAVDLMEQGIRAQRKDLSNINWRNNLSTISGAVNSASSSIRNTVQGAKGIKGLMK